ncbi:MAG: hypothetical protein BWY78_00312 [Alphaproteobacteria bacterium ADurb.Bin438]|nr:MAG: hypothetical protein BWY78_00312 [Alphaproteobacteria bacterium ADurb.Bin438]
MVEENSNNENGKKSSDVYETAENLENEITLEDKESKTHENGEKIDKIEKDKSVVKHTMAPPPPPPPMQAPSIKVSKGGLSTKLSSKKVKEDGGKETVKSSGLYDDNFAAALNLPPYFLKTEYFAMMLGVTVFIGIVLGAVLFSSGSCPPCSDANFGVVKNPEIIPGRVKRCGIAEIWEPCRLFISNSSREEKKVKELYKRASNLSMVPEYKIDSTNLRYANDIIKPGYIAEILIPPLN